MKSETGTLEAVVGLVQCLVTLTRQGLGLLNPHNTPTLLQRSNWKRINKGESEKYVDTDLVLLIYYCILNPKRALVFGATKNLCL